MNALTICIAEIPMRLELDCSDTTRSRIAEHYAAFTIPHAPRSSFTLRIREEPGEPYIPVPNDGSPWQIRTRAEKERIDFDSYYEKGWLDRSAHQGELTLRPRGDPEGFLRVTYAWFVLEQSGLLIHAAGIISKRKGYVFFGHSGSGKTTISRLSLDRTVLSDDLVIVKKRGSKFWLYDLPFHGLFVNSPRANADAELAGVLSLVKDDSHWIAPLSTSEAIARLASCVPFVMAQPAQSARVLTICAELAHEIPVRALHFRQDSGFWEVIDAKQ
jgi:hypothetical protein